MASILKPVRGTPPNTLRPRKMLRRILRPHSRKAIRRSSQQRLATSHAQKAWRKSRAIPGWGARAVTKPCRQKATPSLRRS